MLQEATNEIRNANQNKNNRMNLFQIFKQHETIYLVKIVIYIIMVCVIVYDMKSGFELLQGNGVGQSHHMFTAFVVLLLTTLTDEVVLSSNCKLKSVVGQAVQYLFMLMVLICLAFGTLIFFDVVPVVDLTVVICNIMSVLCCVSPVIELLCDFISRIQDETEKKIIET